MLSAAKHLAAHRERCFAALSMTSDRLWSLIFIIRYKCCKRYKCYKCYKCDKCDKTDLYRDCLISARTSRISS